MSWPCSTRSASSRTTISAARTSSGSPSSVTTLPRRKTSQATWPSSARRTLSPLPASSVAASLDSSIWLRTERLPHQSRHHLAVGVALRLGHRHLHDGAHVLRRRGGGLGDRGGDDRAQCVRVELLGQVALDQPRLRLLGGGELLTAGVAEGGGRLQAALALPAQHGELVAVAFLGGLLQLVEHEPQRADTVLLPRLHRAGEVLLHRVGQTHLPSSIRTGRTSLDGFQVLTGARARSLGWAPLLVSSASVSAVPRLPSSAVSRPNSSPMFQSTSSRARRPDPGIAARW